MRRIWGRLSSVNVQKVVWAAEELGLAYERIDAGGAFGRNRTAEYLAMNPNGLVPVLEEDGFTLWESNAIVRYLGHGNPGPAWPKDPRARATADRWMDFQMSALSEPMRVIFWTLVRTPEPQRDMEAVARAVEAAVPKWAVLDDQLARTPYLAGAEFTLGDIPLGCVVHRWFSLPIARPEQAHLRAWYDRLLARPAYATHVARPLE